MKITTNVSAVDNKAYKVAESGTYYYPNTNDKVIEVLERCRIDKRRIQFFYGDVLTGRDWNEEHDTIGQVGRSTGPIKVPLLIPTSRSIGGGCILTDSILKIRDAKSKVVLYVADNYQLPVIDIIPSDMEGYQFNTVINGTLHGRHKTLRSAKMLKSKLQ
jgi:hypothetical protein